jgi:hypothetical protein
MTGAKGRIHRWSLAVRRTGRHREKENLLSEGLLGNVFIHQRGGIRRNGAVAPKQRTKSRPPGSLSFAETRYINIDPKRGSAIRLRHVGPRDHARHHQVTTTANYLEQFSWILARI